MIGGNPDCLGRTISILGKISQAPLNATATLTLFSTPPVPPGSLARTFVLCVVLDNPAAGSSGALTASAGSGATATDFAGSGSVAVPPSATNPTVLVFAPGTGIVYGGPGLAFNFKITATGVGNCDITALGWTQ